MTYEHREGVSRRKLLAASLAGVTVGQAPTRDGLTLESLTHDALNGNRQRPGARSVRAMDGATSNS
jgi:hypothetical protein